MNKPPCYSLAEIGESMERRVGCSYPEDVQAHDASDRPGHAFISYVREDSERVDRLQGILHAAGINVWRDTANLWPGQDWKIEISQAINTGSLAFIACFSENSERRSTSYQFEELRLAVDQVRLRPPGQPLLIPVRFNPCALPLFDLGSNRTLDSLQRVDLFDDLWQEEARRLVAAVQGILRYTTPIPRPIVSLTDAAVPASPYQPDSALSESGEPESATFAESSADSERGVFLLHDAADIEVTRRVRADLEPQQYDVRWEDGEQVARMGFSGLISRIKECKYLVIILSSAFTDTFSGRNELTADRITDLEQSGVVVVPVLYETCPITHALAAMKFANFTRSPTEGMGQLLGILRGRTLDRETDAVALVETVRPSPTLGEFIDAISRKIRAETELYVATDLGGTKAYISIMNSDGERLFDKKFGTKSHDDQQALLGFIVTSLDDTINRASKTTGVPTDDIKAKISAYGVAFAGPTDSRRGIVRAASNFKIKDFPLADSIKRHFGKPAFVENDANLGTLGEIWKGVARDHRNVIGIVIGTGIGGGIVVDGELLEGSTSAAGEIGHIVIDAHSEVKCGCGQKGCFEALASRKAIAKKLHDLKRGRGESDLRWEERNLGSAELADYVAAGDPDAVEVLAEASKMWGKAVFTLLNVLNPDLIFFGGGFLRHLGDKLGESVLDQVRDEAEKCMNSIYEFRGRKVPIVLGQLDNPMLSGACLLAVSRNRLHVTKQDYFNAARADISENDFQILQSIYNHHPQPTRISSDPDSDFHEDKLRRLRNHGLIATPGGLSFRRSEHVVITLLGRLVIDDSIASRVP